MENKEERSIEVGHLEKVDLSDEYIYEQALRIVEEAEKRDLVLRLIGSTAFVMHCKANRDLLKKAERRLTDVDLITYSSTSQAAIAEMFESIGYEAVKSLGWHAAGRDIFVNDKRLYIDVFKDTLSYCHEISFRGRLELDNPTITLVDLMLEKLQVVEINEKDLKDMAILLLEHDLGAGDPEKVDIDYLAGLWSRDWGFYYTGTTNLDKLLGYVADFVILNPEQKAIVQEKVERIKAHVEAEPKSAKWKIRSKIGTKVRWYEPVETVER